MASKGVAASHGPFRQSIQHNSETTYGLMGDTEADEFKKRDRSPLLEGSKKQTSV